MNCVNRNDDITIRFAEKQHQALIYSKKGNKSIENPQKIDEFENCEGFYKKPD